MAYNSSLCRTQCHAWHSLLQSLINLQPEWRFTLCIVLLSFVLSYSLQSIYESYQLALFNSPRLLTLNPNAASTIDCDNLSVLLLSELKGKNSSLGRYLGRCFVEKVKRRKLYPYFRVQVEANCSYFDHF